MPYKFVVKDEDKPPVKRLQQTNPRYGFRQLGGDNSFVFMVGGNQPRQMQSKQKTPKYIAIEMDFNNRQKLSDPHGLFTQKEVENFFDDIKQKNCAQNEDLELQFEMTNRIPWGASQRRSLVLIQEFACPSNKRGFALLQKTKWNPEFGTEENPD